MARPAIYQGSHVVAIDTEKAKSKLQQASDRRAIILAIIDNGGRMSLDEIDEHFGFDIRDRAIALLKANWLKVIS